MDKRVSSSLWQMVHLLNIKIDLDCSLNNPCGPHGYCRDKTGSIICECKFWWDGTLCDHQTNSGIQVIVLGCLLGALMILFYGLQIGNMIRRRRKQPKKAEKKYSKNNCCFVLHVICFL